MIYPNNDDFVRMTGFRTLLSEQDAGFSVKPQEYRTPCISQNDTSVTDRPSAGSVQSGKQSGAPLPSFFEDTAQRQAHLRGLSSNLGPCKLHEQNQSGQFQVVWRDLAYQVRLSALQSAKECFGVRESGKVPGNDHIDSSLSFEPIPISTKPQYSDAESHYTSAPHAPPDSRNRFVFRNLNGYIRSGEIAAILGPSGAGKTSLLRALCGFETKNYKGSIRLFGGHDKKRMQVSIIPQKDYLIEKLSVRENLLYSSRILNVAKDFDHEAAIEHVTKVLNLAVCIDTLCKNLSGGEYKRVSIAQELLRNPDILILDEPTSGLDSLNCKKLISTLRGLIDAAHCGAISPIAIVMTIHQPDIDIYSMFNHIYCLAPGGRVVFDGHPSQALEVLRTQGDINVGSEQVNVNTINPANLLIEIASKATHGDETIDRLAQYQRDQFTRYIQHLESNIDQDHTDPADWKLKVSRKAKGDISLNYDRFYRDKRLSSKSHRRGSFWYHTSILTKRCFLSTIRDPMVSGMSLGFHLLIPLVMWFVYSSRIGSVTGCPKLIRDISLLSVVSNYTQSIMADMQEDMILSYEGATMFFVSCWAFGICSGVLSAMTFPLNMHILLKELRNGWYGMSCFVLGKTIASFPFEILFPMLSLMLVYYILGMPESYMHWRMFAIALVMASVAMISTSQGLVFGALFMDDTQTSIFMSVAITLPEALLSGFTARIMHMPKVLQYVSLVNPMRYAADLNNIIRYGFGICTCGPRTEAYLKTTPKFMDMPQNLNSVVNYYLSNMRGSDSYEVDTETALSFENAFVGDVPGMNYEFITNATTENNILEKINSDQLDIAQVFAKFFAKSMSYGRQIDGCDGVRAQILAGSDAPPDQLVPYLFGALIGLLVMWKIILFFVVKYKIESYL